MSIPIVAQAITHVGKVRDHNEDAFAVKPELGLYLVADGMGGHAAGEVASALAVTSVTEQVAAGQPLAEAVQAAHQAIIEQGQQNPEQQGMGTTIVAVQVAGNQLHMAWVGDSRIYQMKQGQLTQLSVDHSFVQDMVMREVLTEEEARVHPKAGLLRQALGRTDLERIKVDTLTMVMDHSASLLLCSDGISDTLSRQQLEQALVLGKRQSASTTPQAVISSQLQAIERAVLDTHADDNFTALLINYHPSQGQVVQQKALGALKSLFHRG